MKSSGILSMAAFVTALVVALAPEAHAQDPTTPDLWHTAEARGFHEWTRTVEAAGLRQQLVATPHTVFIADDRAYQQVPATQRQAWQTDPALHRTAVGYTVVPGRLTLAELRQREYVTTLDGQRLAVRTEGDRVWVGNALVSEAEIAGGNGMIYQVDRVILPATTAMPAREAVRKGW
jgi:uncharacterized surface protein with fasciclin (FAS1) repeats